mmetsp:Transcript_59232/g.97488  ORF Transcript_59232/g.97488 Transcript_59232/m.97488 type:complete len:107 (-) Transcript_59232:227-547(-)
MFRWFPLEKPLPDPLMSCGVLASRHIFVFLCGVCGLPDQRDVSYDDFSTMFSIGRDLGLSEQQIAVWGIKQFFLYSVSTTHFNPQVEHPLETDDASQGDAVFQAHA